MFVIDSNFQYIRHFVGNPDVATAIMEDLKSREDTINPEAIKIKDCEEGFWDPGGPLWTGDKIHTFDLGDTKFRVHHQHIPDFAYWVRHDNTQQVRDWNGTKYHKIHSGYLSCICVTPDEYETLFEQLRDPQLIFEGASAQEERLDRMSQAGIVQVAKVQDEEGNDKLAVVERVKPTLN